MNDRGVTLLPCERPGVLIARISTSGMIDPEIFAAYLTRHGVSVLWRDKVSTGYTWHVEAPERPTDRFVLLINRIKAKSLKNLSSTIPVQPR